MLDIVAYGAQHLSVDIVQLTGCRALMLAAETCIGEVDSTRVTRPRGFSISQLLSLRGGQLQGTLEQILLSIDGSGQEGKTYLVAVVYPVVTAQKHGTKQSNSSNKQAYYDVDQRWNCRCTMTGAE